MNKSKPTRKTILVVDDNKNICISIEEQFKCNYEVICAYNETQAKQLLRKNKIDLVILDFMLPQKDGLEFLPEIRSEYPELPIIFLTAYGCERTAKKASSYERVYYIMKPNINELENKVNQILNSEQDNRFHTTFNVNHEKRNIVDDVIDYIKLNFSRYITCQSIFTCPKSCFKSRIFNKCNKKLRV